MSKEILRKRLKLKRNNLKITEINNFSDIISKKCIHYISNNNFDAVVSYSAVQNEANLDKIHKWILNKNIPLLFPKYTNKLYTLSEINSLNELEVGTFGIKEPIKNNETLKQYQKIAWLIPGIGFDRSGNRLGFGKGFYDQLLSKYNGIKIGIGYNIQLLNHLPSEKHDIKMNIIITNKELIVL